MKIEKSQTYTYTFDEVDSTEETAECNCCGVAFQDGDTVLFSEEMEVPFCSDDCLNSMAIHCERN